MDISANRATRSWTRGEIVGRALWEVLRGPLFAWTPRPFWGWRRFVLRAFGARIGAHAHLHATVKIQIPWNLRIGDYAAIGDGVILYSLGLITIGASATISQHAHLCAGSHNFRDGCMPLLKLPITIDDGAWVCADAFVGPNVRVYEGAVVGARAVVVKDVAARTVVAGNPATMVGFR